MIAWFWWLLARGHRILTLLLLLTLQTLLRMRLPGEGTRYGLLLHLRLAL
jgi:hypothetical protein